MLDKQQLFTSHKLSFGSWSINWIFVTMLMRRLMPFFVVLAIAAPASAQRIYRPNSVLANGNWYKISVKESGVYKIDLPFLNSLGVNTSNLPANSIRLFGNGGRMLAESNSGPWLDDLQENAILVV